MTTPRQTVRVFVSSTFRDMHAERDHLVTVVFPELRERVERLGLEFFDVDLRWGVPAKDANGETANSWEYCRQWIDRAEPLFVCLLGQRYGWVPQPQEFRSHEDQARQRAQACSITELEVRHAVLEPRRKRRSYFYLRETLVPDLRLDSDPPARCAHAEFVDPEPAAGRLAALKEEIRNCGRPVRHYRGRWTGREFADFDRADHPLGPMVLEDLWSGVLRDERYVSKEVWRRVLGADPDTDPRYTDESHPVPRELWESIIDLAKPPPTDPLDAEREQMEAFAETRLRWFEGRTRELDQLGRFLRSAQGDSPRLAVVTAAPGQGKSALLARLWREIVEEPTVLGHPGDPPVAPGPGEAAEDRPWVIAHFVGATERSASSPALVKRLVRELDRSGIPWGEDEVGEDEAGEQDFNGLCRRLAERLGNYAGERQVVILLDALNQLSDGHDLRWLPTRLGPAVRIIVSCVDHANPSSERASHDAAGGEATASSPASLGGSLAEDRVRRALDSRQPVLRVPLGPLQEEDVRAIVVGFLREYCKELDAPHIAALTAMPEARNPLYLLVLLAELRTLGGNDMNRIVGERIGSLRRDYPDTIRLFHWVLERLEVFGVEAVRWWCLFLAHGRVGMASRELAALLARQLGTEAAATALRIERGLRRYLQARGPQLDFFHGQLRQAACERYGPMADPPSVHGEVASYFRDLADPGGNRTWRGTSARAFGELPFHLVEREDWLGIVTTLEDLVFLEAKVSKGMAFELVEDFAKAAERLPERDPHRETLGLLMAALRRDVHFIARHAQDHPPALFQCLWNSCWWHDCPEVGQHLDPPQAREPERVPTPPGSNDTRRPELYRLLEDWRAARESAVPGFVWARSLRPPVMPLQSAQIAVIPPSDEISVPDALAIASNGRYLAFVDYQTLVVWDVETAAPAARCESGDTPFDTGLAYSPDGTCLACARRDQAIEIRDAASLTMIARLAGPEKGATGLCYGADARQLLSWSGHAVRLWDIQSAQVIRTFEGHEGNVMAAAMTLDASRVFSVGLDRTLRQWSAREGGAEWVVANPDYLAYRVVVSPDGRNLATACSDGLVRIWDIDGRRIVRVLRAHTDGVLDVVYSADGRRLASASDDCTVRTWDVDNGQELKVFRGHLKGAWKVRYFPDGRHLASASLDGTVRLWDVEAESDTRRLDNHTDLILEARYSPKGNWIGSASHDGTARVWNPRTGISAHLLRGHEAAVTSIDFSADESMAVTGSLDRTVRVWNLRRERVPRVLRGHEGAVRRVRFSPDSHFVASGSEDRTVRIWDVESGEIVAILAGHESGVRLLVYSADGSVLSSESDEGTVFHWEARDGRFVRTSGEKKELGSSALDQLFLDSDATGVKLAFEDDLLAEEKETPPAAWYSGTNYPAVPCDPAHRTFAGSHGFHLFLVRLEGRGTDEGHSLHNQARVAYDRGDYGQAKHLWMELLKNGFEVPKTCCYLARVAFLLEHEAEARDAIATAWRHRDAAPPHILARILWFQLLFAFLERTSPAIPLAGLRVCLQTRDARADWQISPVLDRLKSRLPADSHALLAALVKAMCDGVQPGALDRFPQWRRDPPAASAVSGPPMAVSSPKSTRGISVEERRAFADRAYRNGLWEAAAGDFQVLLEAGEPVADLAPKLVTCLLNAHENLLPGDAGRIEALLARLEASGHGPIVEPLRRQFAARQKTTRKRWWQFW